MIKIQELLMYLEYFDVTCTSLSASVTTKLQLIQFYTNRVRNGRTLRLLSLKASIDTAAYIIEMEETMSELRNTIRPILAKQTDVLIAVNGERPRIYKLYPIC